VIRESATAEVIGPSMPTTDRLPCRAGRGWTWPGRRVRRCLPMGTISRRHRRRPAADPVHPLMATVWNAATPAADYSAVCYRQRRWARLEVVAGANGVTPSEGQERQVLDHQVCGLDGPHGDDRNRVAGVVIYELLSRCSRKYLAGRRSPVSGLLIEPR
jgi:hypothetical protein